MSVFKKIEDLSGDDGFYLKMLNPISSNVTAEELDIFKRVASEIERMDGTYETVLEDDNWRSHLVAYACLMVTNNRAHLDSLKHRFEAGSMVTPQLGVALMRLHRKEMRDYMPAYLRKYHGPEKSLQLGTAVAAHQFFAFDAIIGPQLQVVAEKYCLAIRVFGEHDSFWTNRLGA